jgi:hypothetical protein
MTTLSHLVRPLLTLMFAGTIIYLALTGHVTSDFIQGLAAGLINFWFAEKAALAQPARSAP